MQDLIGFSEVSAVLIFSFGFGLLLECLLLKYLLHVIARETLRPMPVTDARPSGTCRGGER